MAGGVRNVATKRHAALGTRTSSGDGDYRTSSARGGEAIDFASSPLPTETVGGTRNVSQVGPCKGGGPGKGVSDQSRMASDVGSR